MTAYTEKNRQKLIEKLGASCECGKTGKAVYVYAKDVYDQAWMPAKGLYGHNWNDIEPRADDYYLSCNMCWRKRKGLKTIEHGGGSQGKPGCKCDPCRLKRNEYGRNKSKEIRDQAKAWRDMQKGSSI